MQTKILLLALSAAAFSSCSTAYKSGQTPDDVYYSPARVAEEQQDNNREQVKTEPARDYSISMAVRDHRWRDFRDDYSYDNSPYNYTCKRSNYGYYYNPYYYPWVIYTGKTNYKPVNTTPRMVNLNAYRGYNSNVASGKTFSTGNSNPSNKYNNNNSKVGNLMREVLTPSSSSPSNNSRTYTPSSNNNSGSSGSSSSGSSKSGSVSRPGRG